jgi:hypothetical protein
VGDFNIKVAPETLGHAWIGWTPLYTGAVEARTRAPPPKGMLATMHEPPPELPQRLRWLMNVLGTFVLVWTAYCGYAWATHSGIWQLTLDVIASHQRGRPEPMTIAFISWALGLAAVLVVGWPALQLLRRGITDG